MLLVRYVQLIRIGHFQFWVWWEDPISTPVRSMRWMMWVRCAWLLMSFSSWIVCNPFPSNLRKTQLIILVGWLSYSWPWALRSLLSSVAD